MGVLTGAGRIVEFNFPPPQRSALMYFFYDFVSTIFYLARKSRKLDKCIDATTLMSIKITSLHLIQTYIFHASCKGKKNVIDIINRKKY